MDEAEVGRLCPAALKSRTPHFRVDDLRHTVANLLLARNAPITYVAAQLSHADPATTLRSYPRSLARGPRPRWSSASSRRSRPAPLVAARSFAHRANGSSPIELRQPP